MNDGKNSTVKSEKPAASGGTGYPQDRKAADAAAPAFRETKAQDAGRQADAKNTHTDVRQNSFSPVNRTEAIVNPKNIGLLMDVEMPVSVELGRVRMLVKDILELGPGAVVELDKISSEPVDIYLNHKKFAEGEVVVVDQNFGVRITALIGPDGRPSSAN